MLLGDAIVPVRDTGIVVVPYSSYLPLSNVSKDLHDPEKWIKPMAGNNEGRYCLVCDGVLANNA
jgi:hypothetical protein